MFIYVIVNSETLKIYVGQHKGNNLRQYLQQKQSEARHNKSARSRLYRSMRKHPRDSWSIHPIVSDVPTREELDELERHYIRVLKTQHPDVGYNICRGGEGFSGPHTLEALKKMDAKRKKYWRNPANHVARRIASKKMWANPDIREKIIKAIKAAPNTGKKQRGSVPWNKGTRGVMAVNAGSFGQGRPRPANSGAKGPNSGSIRLGDKRNVGRKFSAEHRRNLSISHMGQPAARKGVPHPPEEIRKMKIASHNRWHVRRSRPNPDCLLCYPKP